MTDDELRVKVAELCGWRSLAAEHGLMIGLSPKTCLCEVIPDYPNDLNACHEMEATLTRDQQGLYGQTLMEMMPKHMWAKYEWFHIAHATARQRCLAFCRVMEKPELTEL